MTDHPTRRPPVRRRFQGTLLEWLVLAYVVLFVLYYPPVPGIEDEIGYVNQALVWSRGAISADEIGRPDLAGFELLGTRHLARRHPGRSLLALPFLMIGGVRGTFVSGLLIHLITVGAGAALLSRLGRAALWAVLILFHPTLAIYSRTVMADEAAGMGVLLAALALMSPSRWAGIWAGLAVGLATLMRYQAGLVLPLVAAAFWAVPGRAAPRRDAVLCLLTGGACGLVLIAYNLVVYGSPTAYSARSGYFALRHIVEQFPFYTVALLAIWPGMLLAPLLDRSPLRWLVRVICAVYLAFYSLHYFHDRGPCQLDELILGQRLLAVALPLWIVSYAGVLDDWVLDPLRRVAGDRVVKGLVALACAGLVAATAVAFHRHQRHLEELRIARDELIEHVPDGSLIICRGPIYKLVGIPIRMPSYDLRAVDFGGQREDFAKDLMAQLRHEPQPWYLAVLHREPGEKFGDLAREIVDKFGMAEVPLRTRLLSLYVDRDAPPPTLRVSP
jgi:hypothetical protein